MWFSNYVYCHDYGIQKPSVQNNIGMLLSIPDQIARTL